MQPLVMLRVPLLIGEGFAFYWGWFQVSFATLTYWKACLDSSVPFRLGIGRTWAFWAVSLCTWGCFCFGPCLSTCCVRAKTEGNK
ncbi:unnamed protein product [Cuscuta campestris]|uniref:Uncharacterized protein n=1 Tax=Cuscuta campestris TaxID=132261 RepID=A0A484LTX6_9ASTE|nr:unnamed protein product [Cuscuta campestris]